MIQAAENCRKPILTSWMGGSQVTEARALFSNAHLPDFRTLENAVDAFSHLSRYNTSTSVPDAGATMLLFGAGLLGVGALRRRMNS